MRVSPPQAPPEAKFRRRRKKLGVFNVTMTIFRERNRVFCGAPPPFAMKDPTYYARAADKMANFRVYKPFWRHKPRCTHATR